MNHHRQRHTSFTRILRHLEAWLISPSAAVQDPEQRRRGQLLSLVLLLLIVFGVWFGIFVYWDAFKQSPQDQGVTITGLLLMGVLYGMSRTRYFNLSLIASIGLISLIVFALAVPGNSDNVHMLVYLVIPIWLSSLLLPYRVTAGLLVLHMVGMLAYYARYELPDMANWISFVIVVSIMLLLGARYLTEQERIRQSVLHKTENRYQSFVENIPIGVFRTTPTADGEFMMANPAFVQLLGFESEAELKKYKVSQIYADPANRPGIVAELMSKGTLRDVEVQLKRKDGSLIWGAVTARLAYNEVTGRVYCDCSMKDITQHKQAEAALIEGEQRYRDLFDHSLNGFALHEVVTNAQGKVVDYVFLEANRAFEDLTGLRAADIMGRRMTDVMPGMDQMLSMSIYGHVALTGEPARFEQFFAPLNRYYDIAAFSPRRGQFATLLWDITARVRAEAALRESEAQYRELFEGVDDAVTVHDLEGNILDINEAACRRLGYRRDELLQMTIADLDEPGAYADGFRARLRKQLAHGKLSGIIGAHIAKDGRRIDIEANTKMITYHGQLAVLAVARDITERKQTEEAFKHSQATLQGVFRAAPIGVGLTFDRVLHWTNEHFQRMIGYSAEELTNQSARMLYDTDEEFERVGTQKYAQFEHSPVGTVETHFRRKDGTIIDVLLSSSPLDLADHSAGIAFSALDITERKRIEETLYFVAQQSWTLTGDSFFSSLVEYLATKLKVDYAFIGELHDDPNGPSIHILGYYALTGTADNREYPLAQTPCEQVVGRGSRYFPQVSTLFPVLPPSLADIVAESYLGIPLWDSKGQPLGVIAIMDGKPLPDPQLAESLLQIVAVRVSHELSRRYAEHQVRQERDRAQQYLDIAGVILVGLNERHETTLINRKGREVLGYSDEDIIGRPWFKSFLPEREYERVYSIFLKIVAGDEALRENYESHIVTKAGEERLISWRLRLLHDATGKVVGTLSSGEDITERRQAGDALREQTELAKAMRDITAFINSSLDPKRVFDRILTNLIRVVPHDFADIMMLEGGVAHVVSFHCWVDTGVDEAAIRSVRLPLESTANLRQMATTGEPLIVPDTASFPSWVDIPQTRWIRSYMGVPIRVGGETIGFINVNSMQACFFTDQHVERLQAFADQAGIAINNARSYDDLEHRIIERTIDLSVRNAVAETLSNTLEIEPMLNGVLRTTVERIGVHGGAIHLLSDDDTTLSLAACYGISPETLEQVTGFTSGVANLAALSPLHNTSKGHTLNIPHETGIYAVLSVPIWRQGRIQGIITLAHNEQRPWRAEETRMLDAIGRQIGVALVNARLYTDAVRDEAHIRTILQSVADGLLVFDQHNNLTLMNPAAEALFSFYPSESGGAAQAAVLLWDWLQMQPNSTDEPVAFSLPTSPLAAIDQSEVEERCLLVGRAHAARRDDPAWPCWLLNHSPSEFEMRRCPIYERIPRCALQAHSAIVHDADGNALGTVIALHDVTYFRELDDLKGRFVSTVSHELRTPLSVVLLQVSTLLKYYDRLPDDQRREMVSEIQQQAHNLRELVEDILELSRFDARRSMPQKQWFDLMGHCEELLGTLEPSIQVKNLQLDVVHNRSSSYIHADPQQIMRVLRNLLGNAIKYTAENGQIVLRVEQTTDEVCLTVSDNGIGIAADEQLYIFDRFFRSEQASRMASGHGLGLSITKEIIDLHGGQIELSSTPGEGSTFTVYLPVYREE